LLPAVTKSETLTTSHDWSGIVASDSNSPVAPVRPADNPKDAQEIAPSTDDAPESDESGKPRSLKV
jgi:hypothetical protein